MTVPYWASADGDVQLHLGDCLDVLRALPADSVDAIVTDPPAGIAFMGRDWDDFKRARHRFVDMLAERLGEALRVLKPGGHALVWSIPRTSHWTAWAVEDAGFEVRDCVLHLFGSGFPKSLDVGRAIDKAAGAEREVRNGQGEKNGTIDFGMKNRCPDCGRPYFSGSPCTCPRTDRIAVTEDAARWDGWGTALKPGQEMWWLARKPLQAGSVAGNVLEWGTGALNIAACRVAHVNGENPSAARRASRAPEREAGSWANDRRSPETYAAEHPGEADGRWPANVVLTHSAGCGERCAADCPVGELDRQSGNVKSAGMYAKGSRFVGPKEGPASIPIDGLTSATYADSGGASRFYPVFRHEQVCALYGMLSVCERVSGAAAKSQLSGQQQGSAASAASGSPSRPGAGRPDQLTLSAPTAGSPSGATPATAPSTAPAIAPTRPTGWSAPPAASAGSLCDSCATAIAQSLAATQHGQSPMPTLGLPSTDAFAERILTQNLALYAEALARRGTTSTTTELTTSLGCVVAAISACTTRESDSPTRRSGLPLFKYQAKAPASERPRLDDGTAHETVKPLGFISWAVRLITPPGGTVLDLFGGSGPVAEACIVEGFRAVIIERERKSADLIVKRLSKPIQPVMFGLDAS